MKKKMLSVVMALAVLATLLLGFSVTAFAAPAGLTYAEVHATGVAAEASGIPIASSPLRANANNALYAPDARQNGAEDKFASLRNFNEAIYTFHDVEAGKDRLIANYRGEDETSKPDLSLIEVTWGTGWHVEAVDVYLEDAYVTVKVDGYDLLVPAGEVFIGTAYNKVGVENGLAANNIETGFAVTTEKIGNHQYTHLFFPNNIVYAKAVRLVDVTTDVNSPVPTSTTYNDKDDGFDLDALTAWYTVLEEEGGLDADISFDKLVDMNADGIADGPGAGFEFDLYKYAASGYEYIDTYMSDELGVVTIDGLTTGGYKLVEKAYTAFTPANYAGGIYFNVFMDSVEWLNLEAGGEAPVVVNNYVPNWKTDTSWAGYVTSSAFPMHNKSKFAQLNNVQRSGQSNWAMVMLFEGGATSADIVMGQNTDIGDITVAYTDGGFLVTGQVTNPAAKVTHVHADASSDLARFTKAKGNGNFVVNAGVEMNDDGGFSFTIPYSYDGGTVYVGIHMESALDLNYIG